MKAHAAVAIAPWKVEYQAVTVPDPGPDDVVVNVTHSWISNGTEGSFVRGERIAGDTPRSDADPMPFPHVSGYQKVGIIDSVGSNVKKVRPGDAVFATISRIEDMFYSTGGHISPAVTHISQIWKLPADVDPVSASGLVLTQVGYNVGIRPTVVKGECAVVIGDGMVAHWAAQTLQHRGARVLMIGKHDERLKLFDYQEGDRTVNILNEDALEAVKGWSEGRVQIVADTVGDVSMMEMFYPVMRSDAHLVSAGFYGPHGQIDIQRMRAKEITLHTPAGWNTPRMDATLDMVASGILKTLPLITHRFQAEKAGEAFDLILSRREPVLGVILDWGS